MKGIITKYFSIIIPLVITLAILVIPAQSPIAAMPLTGKIVFVSNRDGNQQIYIMNADATSQTRLTNNSATDGNPKLSTDGKKIVFDSDRDGNREIYVMNADGSNQARLTNNTFSDAQPAWSPDASKIIFSSALAGNPQIWVMNADGSNPVQLTFDFYPDIPGSSESRYAPDWSLDGTRIVFSSLVHGNLESIYVMNADGSNWVQIANAGMVPCVSDPDWSPDNRTIAISQSPSPAKSIIQIVNFDGTDLVSLPNCNLDYEPSYAPGGSKIAFCSRRDGNKQIYVMMQTAAVKPD